MAYNGIIDHDLEEVETEPIDLAEVKLYCRIDYDDDDEELLRMITAAREILEEYTNLSFLQREVTALIRNECGGQELPFGPISGTVAYTDKDDDAIIGVETEGIRFISIECPRRAYIKAIYQGGYEEDKLPESLKEAWKAQVNYMWEHRGDETSRDLEKISPVAIQSAKLLRRVFNEFFL